MLETLGDAARAPSYDGGARVSPALYTAQRRAPSSAQEELLYELHRVFGRLDGVADGPLVLVQLVVAAALGGLVAEEVDGRVLVGRQEAQAERLVPAARRAVDADLATDGKVEGVRRRRTVALHQLV